MDGSCSASVFLASAWAHDHFCNIPFIRNQSPRTAHLQEEKSWASSFEGVLSKNLGMYFSLFHQWLFCRQLWFWGAHERQWAQGLSTPSSWLLSPRTYFKTLSYHRNNDRCMTGLGVESLMSQCLWSLSVPLVPPVYPSWKKIWHFQFPAELKISLELEQKMAVIQTTNSYRAPSIRHILCCVLEIKRWLI